MKLIGELEGAIHSVKMVKEKRALLCELLNAYDVTVEAIMAIKHM